MRSAERAPLRLRSRLQTASHGARTLTGSQACAGLGRGPAAWSHRELVCEECLLCGVSGVETIGGLGKGGFGGVGTAVCFSYRVSLGREKCE